MQRIIALAIISATAFAAPPTDLNGWYPCSPYTFPDEGSVPDLPAECAVYSAPLCYPGICKTPKSVNHLVDIFVKRFPATTGDPETASNVWLLQGGPVESIMYLLHSQLEGKVNVYTMDHRGTGRSTRLDCVAAQLTTYPLTNELNVTDIPACAHDLQKKYGNLASFSTTTAATDLVTFISKYTNGASTIMYGGSYGTMLVERVMHLAPPEVVGYVLDGIATTSGAPASEFMYASKVDEEFGKVADDFMDLCEQESSCKPHFEPNGLKSTLQDVIESFDNNPKSPCAALVKNSNNSNDPPSSILRNALGTVLIDLFTRTLIPPVVYRLNRCSAADIDVLKQFFTTVSASNQATAADAAFESSLLYDLIVFSEMWETPQVPMTEMKSRFTDATLSYGVFTMSPLYCAFSKEKSSSCNEFNVSNYEGNGIIYKRDQYWNKTATIPNQASVLLLSGRLDTQTPHKYAESLFKVLDGDKKELVTFDYAPHATIMSTPMDGVTLEPNSCGINIFASYVRNGGDLTRLDKSCMDKMPPFNLTTQDIYMYSYLGTNDSYDGEFDSSLTSESET
ncbi:Serine protease [Phytophthora megakarya]|uniref:Serine protease n=1 Tax=Phytophthora megakarya TaxID=4795 RepID=A0A225V9Z1_9STRA|nr:Serine protease [Phytophthora megakarya]